MAEWLDRYRAVDAGNKALTGQQHYFLQVKGPAYGVAQSIISFEAVEKIGEPYRITIELTHPEVLARSDYLGRDAVFTIDPLDLTEPRKFSGCITRFSQVKTTKDLTVYRIVVEAHIARLKLTRSSRIYQNRTAPEIIEAVLRRHDFRGYQFLFKLRRKYPEHKFRFQYQVDDWTYIQILMQQEGIYSYIVPGGGSAYVKVLGDNVEIGGSGNLILKIVEVQKSGPGALSLPRPTLTQTDLHHDEKFILSDQLTGRPLGGHPYKIQLANGEIVEGTTSDDGETLITKNDVAQGMKLFQDESQEA